MPGLTKDDLKVIFAYQPPDDDQKEAYEAIRGQARVFAETILAFTPSCPDQTVAIRKLREAVMVANAAVALRGRY